MFSWLRALGNDMNTNTNGQSIRMRTIPTSIIATGFKRTLVSMATCLLMTGATHAEPQALQLVQTIPLPGVEGRIDHIAVDVAGQRLFVAALGNGSVEILDLRTGKRIHSIGGLHEPQGVAYVAEANRIYAACGGDGVVNVYDAKSFDLVTTLHDLDDADNIRYDATAKCLFVGYGSGALAIIDTTTSRHVGDIKLAGHPESFQLEQKRNRIFVNVPTAKHVAVVDREQRRVIATWPFKSAVSNFPMALDGVKRRVFIGCRQPAALIVLDSDSGKEVASVAIGGDTDDVFYDHTRSRIYISCGAGFIDVLDCKALPPYGLMGRIPTAGGARTSLFVPELNRFYLAAPHHGNQPAEVRVYETIGD